MTERIDYAVALRLATKIARSKACSKTPGLQADELEGVAVDALMEALRKDSGKGNIEAFIARVVRLRIIDYKRKHGTFTRHGWDRRVAKSRKPRKRLLTQQQRREIQSATAKKMWLDRREELRAKFIAVWERQTPAQIAARVQKIREAKMKRRAA
jgi:DNA-directed RNA polymerase specialized sigma subunit